MSIKPKEKKCIICGTKFMPFNSLDKTCPQIDCKYDYAMIVVGKQRKEKEKKARQENILYRTKLKEKLKTLSDWKKELQTEINSIVREIDKDWPCIATNSTKGKINAGHYIGTLANPTIRFHLENIWLQSEHSNTWKSGDTIRYQQGIVALFGKEYLDYMNNLQSIPPIKLTAEDIKEKISITRGILKWLKLQDRMFSLDERVSLRKKINIDLGIYN